MAMKNGLLEDVFPIENVGNFIAMLVYQRVMWLGNSWHLGPQCGGSFVRFVGDSPPSSLELIEASE